MDAHAVAPQPAARRQLQPRDSSPSLVSSSSPSELRSSRPTETTRGSSGGKRSNTVGAALLVAMRGDEAGRLVIAPQPRAARPPGIGLPSTRMSLASVTVSAGLVSTLPSTRDAAFGDPALGVAARAQAGARQSLGDALALRRRCVGHGDDAQCRQAATKAAKRRRIALADLVFRVPLHAEAEAAARILDALDDAVRRRASMTMPGASCFTA